MSVRVPESNPLKGTPEWQETARDTALNALIERAKSMLYLQDKCIEIRVATAFRMAYVKAVLTERLHELSRCRFWFCNIAICEAGQPEEIVDLESGDFE
jgi:hypothetical protein